VIDARPVKRAHTRARRATASSLAPDRQSMDDETSGTITLPSSLTAKQPAKRDASRSGAPANGAPPHACQSAPSWHRALALTSTGRDPREARSRGPRSQPAAPAAGGKKVADKPYDPPSGAGAPAAHAESCFLADRAPTPARVRASGAHGGAAASGHAPGAPAHAARGGARGARPPRAASVSDHDAPGAGVTRRVTVSGEDEVQAGWE